VPSAARLHAQEVYQSIGAAKATARNVIKKAIHFNLTCKYTVGRRSAGGRVNMVKALSKSPNYLCFVDQIGAPRIRNPVRPSDGGLGRHPGGPQPRRTNYRSSAAARESAPRALTIGFRSFPFVMMFTGDPGPSDLKTDDGIKTTRWRSPPANAAVVNDRLAR